MPLDKSAKIATIFIGLVVLALLLKTFDSFLRPLAFSVILVLVFIPLTTRLKKHKIPSWLTVTAVILLLISLGYAFTSLMINEAAAVQRNFGAYANQIESFLAYISNTFNISPESIDLASVFNMQGVGGALKTGIITVSNFLTEVVFVIVFAIFLMPTAENIRTVIFSKRNHLQSKRIQESIYTIQKNVKDYLWAKTVISFGTGLTSGFIFWVFGGDFAIAIGILTFFFNYIPNFGSIIAVLIGVGIYFLKFGIGWKLFVVAGLAIFAQLFYGNYLEPKLNGRTLKLSPLLIIISLFVWYWIWGIGGAILAVPLTSIIKITLENFKETRILAKLME